MQLGVGGVPGVVESVGGKPIVANLTNIKPRVDILPKLSALAVCTA